MRTLRKISADAGLVEGSPARVCFISLLENTSLDLKGKKHRCLESTGKTSLLLGDGNRKTNKQKKKLYSEGESGKHPRPRPTAEDGADSLNRPTPNTQGLRAFLRLTFNLNNRNDTPLTRLIGIY